jgi:hypothetical protein
MVNRKRKKQIQRKAPPAPIKKILETEPNSKSKRITQWCLGSILGILIVSVIGNHISAVIPNPFSYFYRLFNSSTTEQKTTVWYTASIQNKLSHTVSISTWKDSDFIWYGDTLKPDAIKQLSETGPIYLQIQGDFIAQLGENNRLTHTYEGVECYELEMKSFDHQPTDWEIKQSPVNKIDEIMGGPEPKVINFVDGTKVYFDVFGPTNVKLKALLPETYEGQMVYPFQMNKERK